MAMGNGCFIFLPNVRDETREGERAVSHFEQLEVLSGIGPCELRSIPARCLWRLDRLFLPSELRGGDACRYGPAKPAVENWKTESSKPRAEHHPDGQRR